MNLLSVGKKEPRPNPYGNTSLMPARTTHTPFQSIRFVRFSKYVDKSVIEQLTASGQACWQSIDVSKRDAAHSHLFDSHICYPMILSALTLG